MGLMAAEVVPAMVVVAPMVPVIRPPPRVLPAVLHRAHASVGRIGMEDGGRHRRVDRRGGGGRQRRCAEGEGAEKAENKLFHCRVDPHPGEWPRRGYVA